MFYGRQYLNIKGFNFLFSPSLIFAIYFISLKSKNSWEAKYHVSFSEKRFIDKIKNKN